MNFISYQFKQNLSPLQQSMRITERSLSSATKLSRTCIRHILGGKPSVSVASIQKLAGYLGLEVLVTLVKPAGVSEFSSVATGYEIERDGFNSWKIHLMNFVDQFRKEANPLMVALAPHSGLEPRLKALTASTVRFLCREADLAPPKWSEKRYFLEVAWFPAEINSLKASAIRESPVEFRNNNIFVLSNFLSRV